MAHCAQDDRCRHSRCLSTWRIARPKDPEYIHISWPKRSWNPQPRKKNPGHALQSISTTAGQDLVSRNLLKSARLLLPHASTVALAFFMALLMARPFIAAFFITLLAFFAFMAAFIAVFFMADY